MKPPAPALTEWIVGSPDDVGVGVDDSSASEVVGVADEGCILLDAVCEASCAIVDEK